MLTEYTFAVVPLCPLYYRLKSLRKLGSEEPSSCFTEAQLVNRAAGVHLGLPDSGAFACLPQCALTSKVVVHGTVPGRLFTFWNVPIFTHNNVSIIFACT